MGNMFFKHLYHQILIKIFLARKSMGSNMSSHCKKISMLCSLKTHQTCICSTCHLKEVIYIICVHKLEQNFNFGHKWQFGKSLDYKICIMGNTTHPKHEGACFFQSWIVIVILVPWRIETLSTPKPIRLEARLVLKRPQIVAHLLV